MGPGTLLTASVVIALAAVLVQMLLLVTVGGGLVGTWVTLFFAAFGIGGIFPATMSSGQSLGRERPGPRPPCSAPHCARCSSYARGGGSGTRE
ncbi:hypothetical protein [Streptomyces coeruleorubidus]|uniref:hypothetical protein n=1 Tax=Streptomyces coeruleorubidus TaxID=116188 RepID=UPI003691CE78